MDKLSLRGLLESQNKEVAKAKTEPSCTNTKGSFRFIVSTPVTISFRLLLDAPLLPAPLPAVWKPGDLFPVLESTEGF